jgi:hypothetical protein
MKMRTKFIETETHRNTAQSLQQVFNIELIRVIYFLLKVKYKS